MAIDVPLDHAARRPLRIVLDTNASLALFAWEDPDCAALAAALRDGRLQAVANAATREEWLRVLSRDQLRLTAATRERAAQAFNARVRDVTALRVALPAAATLPRCRDPDDQMFLELAHAAAAGALISRDRELLRLSRRTERSSGFVVLRPEAFCCEAFPGLSPGSAGAAHPCL